MKIDLDSLSKLVENYQIIEDKELSISWDGIPDIPLSTMTWANANTENPRAQINTEIIKKYFSNISGNTFSEKINSIKSTTMNTATSGQVSLQEAIGRLLALKTFISNLTDFSADSAGKNFEAIFAALMGGQVIVGKDSEETADVIIGDKLYGIKLVGSMGDNNINILINSVFAKGKDITYIIAEKKMSKGYLAVSFYKGIITVDNIMDLFVKNPLKATDEYYNSIVAKQKSQKGSEDLPKELQELFSSREFNGTIPLPPRDTNGKYINPLELWNSSFGFIVREMRKHPAFIINSIHKYLFNGRGIPGFAPKDEYISIARNFYTKDNLSPEQKRVVELFNEYIRYVDSLNKETDNTIASNVFDPNKIIIAEEYNKLSLEEKIEVLKNTVQSQKSESFYLNTGNKKVFEREGSTIVIETKELEDLYASLRGSIDKRITEIFLQMKSLSDNINFYFAGGMKEEDDPMAQKAIDSANNIAKNTQEIRTGGTRE